MESEIKDSVVYTLELEDGCKYVGYTKNLKRRLTQHFLGEGAKWTKLHKPIGLESVVYGDTKDENRIAAKLIKEQGYDKVRGGVYIEKGNEPPIDFFNPDPLSIESIQTLFA